MAGTDLSKMMPSMKFLVTLLDNVVTLFLLSLLCFSIPYRVSLTLDPGDTFVYIHRFEPLFIEFMCVFYFKNSLISISFPKNSFLPTKVTRITCCAYSAFPLDHLCRP